MEAIFCYIPIIFMVFITITGITICVLFDEFRKSKLTKRKLAFVALATSFSFSIIPSVLFGIFHTIPIGSNDDYGAGIEMLLAMEAVTLVALVIGGILVIRILFSWPHNILYDGITVIMNICFVINCFCYGLDKTLLYVLLGLWINSFYYIGCTYLIEKAKTLPMKIAAAILTITSFIIPYLINILMESLKI